MKIRKIYLLTILIGTMGFLCLKILYQNKMSIFTDSQIILLEEFGLEKRQNTRTTPLPLLTMFTTFKEDAPHHCFAHRLVILNWASFGSAYVKPVLFTNLSMDYLHQAVQGADAKASLYENRTLAEHALLNGWDVLPIPSVNPYGTPHLKAMYKEVFKKYNSTFYGYANGDLLFDDSLIENLKFVKTRLKDPLYNNVLLVGRRSEVYMYRVPSPLTTSSRPSTSAHSVTLTTTKTQKSTINLNLPVIAPKITEDYIQRFEKAKLKQEAKGARLAPIYAIDYFFFTRENCSFNWSAIPDVVIGRVAYDQYLIAMAIKFSTNSIDLTRTMLVVHLAKPNNGQETGHSNIDRRYNLEVIGHGFPYNDGLTSTTFYFVQQNKNMTFQLVHRRNLTVYE